MTSSAAGGEAGGEAPFYTTSRDVYSGGAREDVSTESGVAMSDDGVLLQEALLQEAQPSAGDGSKQRHVVDSVVGFLRVSRGDGAVNNGADNAASDGVDNGVDNRADNGANNGRITGG